MGQRFIMSRIQALAYLSTCIMEPEASTMASEVLRTWTHQRTWTMFNNVTWYRLYCVAVCCSPISSLIHNLYACLCIPHISRILSLHLRSWLNILANSLNAGNELSVLISTFDVYRLSTPFWVGGRFVHGRYSPRWGHHERYSFSDHHRHRTGIFVFCE